MMMAKVSASRIAAAASDVASPGRGAAAAGLR